MTLRLAVVGAGWAGMAAAVEAASHGADVTVFESTRTLGGRARALAVPLPDDGHLTLDNGQHILIGAYTETLGLMQRVGVDLSAAFMNLPLSLPQVDGSGLRTPDWATRWPAPLDALAAISTTQGWSWRERLALVGASLNWRRRGFSCDPQFTVADLCARLPARVMQELIEPLCVSALNTPVADASAAVFLHVLRDALFGPGFAGFSGSSLLLPRADLSRLFPDAAAEWLLRHGGSTRLRIGTRVSTLRPLGEQWMLGHEGGEEAFDRVIWATAASPAEKAIRQAADACDEATEPVLKAWARCTRALPFTAITTVYAHAPGARLSSPMFALRAEPDAQASPAQFVFDRGLLQPDNPVAQGLLAFVVSASPLERDEVQARVIEQGRRQLDLPALQAVQTVVEKRATFACTPGLARPPQAIVPGLWAAGDYVAGPYPATLEGAVRSGLAAAGMALHPR